MLLLWPSGNYLVRGKDGGMPGYTSYAAVIPELRWSVAMLWNGDSVDLNGAIANSTLVLPSLIAAVQALQVPGGCPLAWSPFVGDRGRRG